MGKVIVRPPLLNERLKQLRKEFGYSYKKLEELTGISRSSLQRYEANPHSDIPLNKLNTIAEVYKVSVSYLLGYESRDMPFEYLKSLSPLLHEIGYEIHYDEYQKVYELWIKDSQQNSCFHILPLSYDQLSNLKETTLSYLKFKINELISAYQPPTTE